MSESEIRRILNKACEDLDRIARKAMLPTAVGASLALTGCATTPRTEATSDPVHTGGVQTVADAGGALEQVPPPDMALDAGAAPVEAAPTAVDAAVPQRPRWDPPKPYMAPDAEPLYRTIAKKRAC